MFSAWTELQVTLFDKDVIFNNFSLTLRTVFTPVARMTLEHNAKVTIPSFFKIKILHDWEVQN
jgi:hypothetical protein